MDIDNRSDTLPIPPLPLLITGISGVAGYNAFRYFHRRFPGQVIGIRQRDNWRLTGEAIEPCDVEDPEQLRKLFQRFRFASVLNGTGNCALRPCELDPAMAWRLNVASARSLLDALDRFPARLVHLSIDLVYSGRRGSDYPERAPTDPVTQYGKSMAAAERLVRLAQPRATILRISLPMGPSLSGHAGAIDWIQSRFRHRRPATLYFDEVRTPTYSDCMNRVFQAVLAREDLPGIYHAGGPQRLSLYQIAQIVNRVGGYDPRCLMGCWRIQAGPVPPRAGNVALDSRKLAQALGFEPFDPWPADPRWLPTDRQWHWRRDLGPAGSPALLARVLYHNPNRG
jgi:dTDP-4-dehydrorhamnose reductase